MSKEDVYKSRLAYYSLQRQINFHPWETLHKVGLLPLSAIVFPDNFGRADTRVRVKVKSLVEITNRDMRDHVKTFLKEFFPRFTA